VAGLVIWGVDPGKVGHHLPDHRRGNARHLGKRPPHLGECRRAGQFDNHGFVSGV
jgi:hypothetical protein